MLSSVFNGVFVGWTLNRKMTKPNQATAVSFISPSLTLWLQDKAAAAASSVPLGLTGIHGQLMEFAAPEGGGWRGRVCGAGHALPQQGLELLRDVVALRCPAALQRGRF